MFSSALAVTPLTVLCWLPRNNPPAVGADVDQYITDPELQLALITSAMKNVDIAVYNYLKTVADGSVQAGISTGTLQNGGVGLAPFHEWDSKIPTDLKAQIQQAIDGIRMVPLRLIFLSEVKYLLRKGSTFGYTPLID